MTAIRNPSTVNHWLLRTILCVAALPLIRDTFAQTQSAECERSLDDGTWICVCHYPTAVLPPIPSHNLHVRVSGCDELYIADATFANAIALRSVQLEHIAVLRLTEGSLRFHISNANNPVSVNFVNVTIPVFPSHSVHGFLDGVRFEGSSIGHFKAFAVSPTLDMRSLVLVDCIIERADRHTLKKFSVATMEIRNCNWAHEVPSTMVYNVIVTERLLIERSKFGRILPNAFQFEDVRSFDMADNRIQVLNGSAFHMRVADRVRVHGNHINALSSTAFLAITSTYPTRPQEHDDFRPPAFSLTDNRVDIPETPFRLQFAADSFDVNIAKLRVITPISCDRMDQRLGVDNAFLKQYGDAVYFASSDGGDGEAAEGADSTYAFLVDRKCMADQTVTYVVAGVSIVVVVLLTVVFVVSWQCWRRRRAIEQMTMVQPEPKTYRETQIVIQIENAGLLKTDL